MVLKMDDKVKMSSVLNASEESAPYIEALYESFIQDPNSVSQDWKIYFETLPKNPDDKKEVSHKDIIKKFKNQRRKRSYSDKLVNNKSIDEKQIRVIQLIQSYRNRGHQRANLDPLGIRKTSICEDLDYEYHGLEKSDLDKKFNTDTLNINQDEASLEEIINSLKKIYCGTLGIEYNYITNTKERLWFQDRLEPNLGKVYFKKEEKINLLKRLNATEGLAKFLSTRYPGMKRFGTEGAESLIPLVDSLIQNCSIFGAEQICLGMSHRGRLNLLVNVLGKSSKELFSEFEEDYELEGASTGDVKYHQGFSSNILTPNGEVHVSLNNNPSHLEIVNPVIEGSVRARQERLGDKEKNLVIPILIHGDAAFSGQGVVMETLQMSQTRGYGVGGTIHVIVNNQIGFTTSDARDSRSTLYSTDVAKMIECPILHVNGDDPEMVVFAAKLACEYRYTFKKDIIIDMFCFRRRGHNEADEPSATQPLMYKKIKTHKSVRDQYQDKLITEGIISKDETLNFQKNYRNALEKGELVTENLGSTNEEKWFDWTPYLNRRWNEKTDTTFNQKKFNELGDIISSTPIDFDLQKQVSKILDDRKKMNSGEIPINWGFAENMAYATLLSEGYPIRFSGQDVRRGTFAHRHSVVHDQKDGTEYMPLVKIAEKNNTIIDIYDSLLSEEAVLGFEYGYSTAWPSGLVIWEAQFGDFANGAQVVIDQFIVSAEHKWQRLSGLVMLLPHGYEGQGPEHSSARLERYLQLCAHDNIQVCTPTTPAQIYHLLRLQTIRKMRRPLIVISPKSLLRNPMATSSLEELINGSFMPVIDDIIENREKIKKVILCSGKVFYDLIQKKKDLNSEEVAIVRIEQLYSFPYEELELILRKYNNSIEFIWCQEEPANQGAWFSHRHRIQRVLDRFSKNQIKLISRPSASAPAVGLNKLHRKQQENLINEAFKD
jgi:2-oxoglutarate dehydrogenase E1 component